MVVSQVFPNYNIYEVPEIDSTNLYAEKLLVKDHLPEGSLIITNNQSAGIGQANNKWESEPFKNLTATVVLYPEFLNATNQFYLSIIVSLAVCRTIKHFIPDSNPLIKWPNDIFCNNHKIAGILIKNHIMGYNISQSIAGLGLNINQTVFLEAPSAISMKLISGVSYNVQKVMTKWHSNMADYYFLLKHLNEKGIQPERQNDLKDEYLSKLYLKDQQVDYIINNVQTRATITGVDQHGQLILVDANHKKYVCGLKEVVFPVIP